MMPILTGNPRNRGFTLMEIVISMGLITIALLAVFRLQAQNLDLQSEAQVVTISRYLAQDRLSMIRGQETLIGGNRSGDFGEDFPAFTYEEQIEEVSGRENLFKVTITVFPEGERASRNLTIETYVFRKKT